MRFRELRQTLFKGIHTPEDNHFKNGDVTVFNPVTPRWLSPFRDKQTGKLRLGVEAQDIPQPALNRASRRSVKFPKVRNRGVALKREEMPWRAA